MECSSTLTRVVDTITEVTRYPKSLLDIEADLENELGIDSVKLVEILVAIGRKFDVDLINVPRDSSIRTIRQMACWLTDELDRSHRNHDKPNGKAATLGTATVPPRTVDAESKKPSLPVERPSSPARAGQPAEAESIQPRVNVQASPPPIRVDRPGSFGPHHTKSGSDNSGARSLPERPQGFLGFPLNDRDSRDSNEELMESRKPLSGRLAFVTGSGRGVGKTIVRLLAKRGATVIVNSFHSRELGEETTAEIISDGGSALHLWGSIANPAHVDEIFNEIERRFGYLDILVCNASDGRLGGFMEIAAEDMERAFRTNVIGHHHCARRAAVLMERRGGGSIVTMSSIAARRYVEGLGAQGVIKAAVESLTRHLACELGNLGIRANCVAGGPVYGDVLGSYPEARATLNYWETLVPDGELCSPSDLARTVAFLVSEEARGVNGAVWNVDHGLATRSHSRPLPRMQATSSADLSFNGSQPGSR